MSTTCGDSWRRRTPAWRSTPFEALATSSPRPGYEPPHQISSAPADHRARRAVLGCELPRDRRVDLWRAFDRWLASRPRARTACGGPGQPCLARPSREAAPRAPTWSAAGLRHGGSTVGVCDLG